MDLDLTPVKTQGRPAKPCGAEIVRALIPADLALLEGSLGVKPASLRKLRDSHHSIARLIAQAIPGTEISQITGYSQSRISILKADPAFQELVTFYRERLDEAKTVAFADAQARLAALNVDLIEELHDRLQDSPETINNDTLLDAIKATSDRTGNGPSTKSTNLNVNVDLASRIEAGRRRVAQLGTGSGLPVLDGTGEGASTPTSPGGRGEGSDE